MIRSDSQIQRAQGCLMGQIAGDSLGSLVEFLTPQEISRRYPDGLRKLADGGTWNTLAGQPTDDSELALSLARVLVDEGDYNPESAFASYKWWLDSNPFDCGNTIARGLRGTPNQDSQANGALMRISPMGIFGASRPLNQVAQWAREDAALTHPNPVCVQANALYAMAIAQAIKTGDSGESIYQQIVTWAIDFNTDQILLDVVRQAADHPPSNFVDKLGWVLIAFQNSLWQLINASDFESGVVDTVARGGDTDTNGAICGALLGAVHGLDAVPDQWQDKILNCRPSAELPHVANPRPDCFWPVDIMELATQLLDTDNPQATAAH